LWVAPDPVACCPFPIPFHFLVIPEYLNWQLWKKKPPSTLGWQNLYIYLDTILN
jgi:hypothetical protein